MVSGIDLVARFVPEFHAAFGQTIAVPINRGAGIVAPNLDQILLQVAGSVHRHGANEFELVDLGSLLFLIAGIHGGQVVANAGAGRESAASVLVMTSTGISPLACAMHLEAAL